MNRANDIHEKPRDLNSSLVFMQILKMIKANFLNYLSFFISIFLKIVQIVIISTGSIWFDSLIRAKLGFISTWEKGNQTTFISSQALIMNKSIIIIYANHHDLKWKVFLLLETDLVHVVKTNSCNDERGNYILKF